MLKVIIFGIEAKWESRVWTTENKVLTKMLQSWYSEIEASFPVFSDFLEEGTSGLVWKYLKKEFKKVQLVELVPEFVESPEIGVVY